MTGSDVLDRIDNISRNYDKVREFLVIDDSKTIRLVVSKILKESYPTAVIREAHDGKSALGELKKKKVDLIITDLAMPGMDGFAFLALLKNNLVLCKKPCIVLSSYITEEVRINLTRLPNISFLEKPVRREKLLDTINNMLLNAPLHVAA